LSMLCRGENKKPRLPPKAGFIISLKDPHHV
jgi:hypothetical protein